WHPQSSTMTAQPYRAPGRTPAAATPPVVREPAARPRPAPASPDLTLVPSWGVSLVTPTLRGWGVLTRQARPPDRPRASVRQGGDESRSAGHPRPCRTGRRSTSL